MSEPTETARPTERLLKEFKDKEIVNITIVLNLPRGAIKYTEELAKLLGQTENSVFHDLMAAGILNAKTFTDGSNDFKEIFKF